MSLITLTENQGRMYSYIANADTPPVQDWLKLCKATGLNSARAVQTALGALVRQNLVRKAKSEDKTHFVLKHVPGAKVACCTDDDALRDQLVKANDKKPGAGQTVTPANMPMGTRHRLPGVEKAPEPTPYVKKKTAPPAVVKKRPVNALVYTAPPPKPVRPAATEQETNPMPPAPKSDPTVVVSEPESALITALNQLEKTLSPAPVPQLEHYQRRIDVLVKLSQLLDTSIADELLAIKDVMVSLNQYHQGTAS